MNLTKQLGILLITLMLIGCDGSEQQGPAESSQAPAPKAGIAWFDGSVDAAFAASASSGKPVFLYWGAVWCPPCQEIKSTVFKSSEFINLSRLFIPVYLDGDTDRAQNWGETFGVKGYPTMIVFNPDREEVTRIPGGIDIDRYNTVLELSLNQMRPTSQLVSIALSQPGQLLADDFYQLAYYSWGQDSVAVPEGTDKANLFRVLADHAPAGELATRFYLNYLIEMTAAIEADETTAGSLDGAEVVARMTAILTDRNLTLAGWDTLAYYPDELLALPVFSDAERSELQTLYKDRIFDLRHDPMLSKAEQMAGWLPAIHVATLDEAVPDDEMKTLLRTEMQSWDKATPDSFERQSVINQMSYIYRNAKMLGDAKRLLLAELEKSASPYYFMSSLASLAEKDGDFVAAIEWRKKAFDHAKGEATRFQWGTNYVRAMIRMTPDDADCIVTASMALLAEFEHPEELFAGRNFRILKRFNEQLGDWQEDQGAVELGFKTSVESLCARQRAESLELSNCRSLFDTEAEAVAAS